MDYFINFIKAPAIILVLVGSITSAILSLITAIKSEKTVRILSFVTFGVCFLTIAGGVLSGYSGYMQTLSLNNKTNQFFEISEKNSQLGLQIADLSRRNQELSEFTLNSVTSGDSYPTISVPMRNGEFGGFFVVSVHGENPLYDVRGKIFDVADYREAEASGQQLMLVSKEQSFTSGNISPGYPTTLFNRVMSQPVKIHDFKDRQSYRFIAHFYTRYHYFTFHLALEPDEKNEDHWLHAWEVFCDQEKKPLAQSIPDDFPKDAEGKVDFLLMPKVSSESEEEVITTPLDQDLP
jgi:hypothetical protein